MIVRTYDISSVFLVGSNPALEHMYSLHSFC